MQEVWKGILKKGNFGSTRKQLQLVRRLSDCYANGDALIALRKFSSWADLCDSP